MKTLARYDNLSVPSYALSYLVNGDSSGLLAEDINAIDNWYAQFQQEAEDNSAQVIFAPESEDEYFTSSPEFGLPCDCVDYTVLIVK